ncbi:MAG: YraN family protein [Faecalibacterium sp.]|nr:YraN family protein [Ruminococcus sp.]MCM1393038.1 YraN family protein [Ruminococcus sp.]MCM1484960.1 YraN family protein [Faecalibacterium sp.]
MDSADVGKLGETFAADYFTAKCCRVLCRNYHSLYGEIDVIVESDTYLIFVEVKTRSGGKFSLPREAVDRKKQKRIILTAMQYMQENLTDKQPRFDVFEIMQNNGRINNFNLIENAFDLSDFGDDYGIF